MEIITWIAIIIAMCAVVVWIFNPDNRGGGL